MEYILTGLFFALVFSIKGGLLGRIFTNWDRTTKRLKRNLSGAIDDVRMSWDLQENLFPTRSLLASSVRVLYTAIFKWLLDGSIISWILAGLYAFACLPWEQAILFTLSYALIFQSMGEEAGAVGDYKGGWGDYVEYPDNFGRAYGVKKAFQYGAVLGGAMALTLASWTPFIAGALMPACYYAGNSLYCYVKGGEKRGWSYSEPLWGLVFGIAVAASYRYLLVW